MRSADCIYVVKSGKVVEQGSHDDLVRDSKGVYTSLISRQMDAQKKLETKEDESPRSAASKHELL